MLTDIFFPEPFIRLKLLIHKPCFFLQCVIIVHYQLRYHVEVICALDVYVKDNTNRTKYNILSLYLISKTAGVFIVCYG